MCLNSKGPLSFSWRRSLSYRNQSTDLQSKSMDWFLNDRDIRHERANKILSLIDSGDMISEAHPGPPQTSKIERFATLVNGWKPLTNVANLFILDIFRGPDCIFEYYKRLNFIFFCLLKFWGSRKRHLPKFCHCFKCNTKTKFHKNVEILVYDGICLLLHAPDSWDNLPSERALFLTSCSLNNLETHSSDSNLLPQ